MNERLKIVRQQLDKTQLEMSVALSVKQSFYSDLENKRRNVSPKLIAKLKEVLGVSSDYMYTGIGDIIIDESYKMYPKNVPQDVPLNRDDAKKGRGDSAAFNGASTKEIYFESSRDDNRDRKEFNYSMLVDENKIDYYYRKSEYRLDMMLSGVIEGCKLACNSYNALCEVSKKLGAPERVNEKFNGLGDFSIYKKEIDRETRELHDHLTDKKLFKCIRLTNYEEDIEHINHLIYNLIDYMNIYHGSYRKEQNSHPGVDSDK